MPESNIQSKMDKICTLEEKQTPKCSDILLSKKLQNKKELSQILPLVRHGRPRPWRFMVTDLSWGFAPKDSSWTDKVSVTNKKFNNLIQCCPLSLTLQGEPSPQREEGRGNQVEGKKIFYVCIGWTEINPVPTFFYISHLIKFSNSSLKVQNSHFNLSRSISLIWDVRFMPLPGDLNSTTTFSLGSNLSLFFLKVSLIVLFILFLLTAPFIPLAILIPNFCPSSEERKRYKTKFSPNLLDPFFMIWSNSDPFLTLIFLGNPQFPFIFLPTAFLL